MTIELALKNPYKSISSLQKTSLPDFTVLTGLNGAGKTHLLEAIHTNHVVVRRDSTPMERLFLQPQRISPGVNLDFHIRNVVQSGHTLWNYFSQNTTKFGDKMSDKDKKNGNYQKLLVIGRFCGKDISELTEREIKAHNVAADIEMQRMSNDPHKRIFQVPFAQTVMAYLQRYRFYLENRIYQKFGSTYPVLSDEEFRAKYGPPPWVLANRLIEESGYKFNDIPLIHEQTEKDVNLRLIDKFGNELKINDLSGGEQTLMALAFSLYNSSAGVPFPELMMLDEAGANLHPSMMNQFLKTLHTVLVEEYGISVLLVTHSPTMVVLSPPGSIYKMSREEPRITSTTADEAIGLLTTGLPTLRVSLDNCRQVFVEADVDAFVFSNVYEVLRDDLSPLIGTAFIPSGTKKEGGCTRVKEMVKNLRSNGVNTVFGLIDRDVGRDSTGSVFILGEGERYAVENFLLDPLLLCCAVARVSASLSKEIIGAPSYRSIGDLTEEELQQIVRLISEKVGLWDDDALVESRYLNGTTLKIPSSFCSMKGHDLMELVFHEIPQLNQLGSGYAGNQQDKVLKAMSREVLADYGSFLPAALKTTFSRFAASSPGATG